MSKKILVVEDDMIISMVTKRYVESLGHKVVQSVRSGEQAIKAVKEHNPDIILMDVRIVGAMDGIEVMEEIMKFSNAKAIYISGNSEIATKERAEKTNMLGFCIKPIFMEDLKSVIDAMESF